MDCTAVNVHDSKSNYNYLKYKSEIKILMIKINKFPLHMIYFIRVGERKFCSIQARHTVV
jgi:hypothetical protein